MHSRFTRRTRLAVTVLALAAAGSAPALAGTRTSVFAPIDPGVRASGMGGAYSAVGGEPTGLYWNPATLYFQDGKSLEFSYSDLYGLGTAERTFLSYGWKSVFELPRFENDRVVVTRDTESGPGYALSVQSLFLDLSEANYSELSIGAGAAWGYGDRVSVGLSLQALFVSSDFDQVSALGYNLGAGLCWRYSKHERLALAIPRLISRVFWDFESTERLPLGLNVGWTRSFTPDLLFSADLEVREGEDGLYRLAAGGEWWVLPERLAVRAGYRRLNAGLETVSVPTFGLGVRFLRLRFDYAYRVEPDALGDTHRIGLLLSI